MTGKKLIIKKNLKSNNLVFFSVTIERQTNEIRLRIRNLTTEDQGICHKFSFYINKFVFFTIGTWECMGTDSAGRPSRKSFQLIIKGLLKFLKKTL
jgi:hypothetical protein